LQASSRKYAKDGYGLMRDLPDINQYENAEAVDIYRKIARGEISMVLLP
jgi:hypothetical protein